MGFWDNWDPVNLTAPQLGEPSYDQYGYLSDVQRAGGNQAGARQGQTELADLLMARARGEGPSIAEMQLQQALEQNKRAAAGGLAGIRGMNPALAQRLLLNQQAQMSQQAAGQAALLRAQEMQAAQQAAGAQFGQMRGQDINLYGTSGQLGAGQSKLAQDRELANMQAKENEINRRMKQKEADEAARAAVIGGIVETAGNVGLMAAGAPPVIGSGGGGSANDKYFLPDDEYNTLYGPQTTDTTSGRFAGGIIGKRMANGGKVPMDSPKRDTVKALLSPDEIVLPRSVALAEDAPDKARAFVQALKERKSPKEAKKEAFSKGGTASFGKIKELEARIKKLESSKK